MALPSSPCWNYVFLLDIQQLHVTKNIVYVTEIINLPLVSGIMLLCSASLYMPMLTLGSHRPDCSVLGLTLFMFMMKFEFSCQSLELISRIAQPFCLNNIEEAAFLYPTNCRYFLLILFIHIFGRSIHTYFFRCKVSASHISASTRCLILWIFSKTFPSAAHPKKTFHAQGWNNSIIPCFLCFPCQLW